jgi:mannose-6-phosphate isomerase-like protein (cupin superfamily)
MPISLLKPSPTTPSVQMDTVTVEPGKIYQFPADMSQARLCIVSKGRLDVSIGGFVRNMDPFVVQPGDSFGINPGDVCAVRNREGVEVVVYEVSVKY